MYPKNGAGKETRTLDINLGKVALYQLSYTRINLFICPKLFTAQFRKAGVCILTYNLSYYTPYVRVRLWSRLVDKHKYHPA